MGAASKWASSSHVGGKREIWEHISFFKSFFHLFLVVSSFLRDLFCFVYSCLVFVGICLVFCVLVASA